MERGTILGAVRRDARNMVIGTGVLLLVCAGVLGYNWKFFYNWFTGPYEFDAALADAPGPRQWVRAHGTSLGATGATDVMRFRRGVGRLLNPNGTVTAEYHLLLAGDRLLLVRMSPGSAPSDTVEGRLEALPDSVRTGELGQRLYPWMVAADTSYRWSPNLFVMVGTPLFALFLLFFVSAVWRSGRVERHPAIVDLKRFGPPLQVVESIENDMMAAGDKARVGNLWVGSSWVVVLGSSIYLYPVADLIAVAYQKTIKKSGSQLSTSHAIRFWRRGKSASDDVDVSVGEAAQVVALFKTRLPWCLAQDAAAFDKSWSKDRQACEREADAHRTSAPAVG